MAGGTRAVLDDLGSTYTGNLAVFDDGGAVQLSSRVGGTLPGSNYTSNVSLLGSGGGLFCGALVDVPSICRQELIP